MTWTIPTEMMLFSVCVVTSALLFWFLNDGEDE